MHRLIAVAETLVCVSAGVIALYIAISGERIAALTFRNARAPTIEQCQSVESATD